ncbi:MAG: hypothetical protein BGO70_09995 [Bacteroidetes bacterium 43-93]|nr:DUF4249 domain-containing protein [Bacteroidota bacterium]OJX00489.1 MAG: hypothetical protein BGO70_09995 [Bacteroidetes bacterium 43-93]
MSNIFSKSNTRWSAFIAFFVIVIFTLTSCEKEVKINLPPSEQKVVVDGAIETGLPPYVILTSTISYFSTIDINTLQNSFLHDAVITVSDGNRTINLKEYSIDTGVNGNKFYFYSIDTSVKPYFIGQVEKQYKLHIEYGGKTYEAYTKIPTPTSLDSVTSVQPDPPFDREKNPTARQIRIFFKDPDTTGNFVRYFTKKNSEPYFPGVNSVYNDDIINGIAFQTTLELGYPRSSSGGRDSLGVCYPGDTVTLKWCAIDRHVYDFWSTYEFSLTTVGNPFSSPIQVKSNINNGALGVWSGYGSVYKTLIIE